MVRHCSLRTGGLTERRRTLLAASRACSMSSLIFLMFSVMLLSGENCDVRFSTSDILSFRDGMVFNKFFTAKTRRKGMLKRDPKIKRGLNK